MKINAINNTNFKGLYVNKSHENDGNWKMEYYPYSWEMMDDKFYGRAYSKELNIFGPLPDNEARRNDQASKFYYWDNKKRGYETSCDIFGTEFYYCDYDKNVMRSTITDKNAMNLEDSLKVRDKKLDIFLNEKEQYKKQLEDSFNNAKAVFQKEYDDFYEASDDYERGFFDRSNTKQENKEKMVNRHADKMKFGSELSDKISAYVLLRNSIDEVSKTKQKGVDMISEIEEAKKENKLIDISRRDINDPNKILWDALHNAKEVAGKLIALPHRILKGSELLKMAGDKIKSSELPNQCIKIVDKLIQTRG